MALSFKNGAKAPCKNLISCYSLVTALKQVNKGNKMITEIQANIQALATVESLSNDIDALYVLDQQAKALAEQVKAMKAAIADKYDVGTHKGELHSVNVALFEVKGTVDYAALCVAYGITDEVLNTFRKEGRADIRVTPKK